VLVLIRGGGDLASGVAMRLYRAGLRVVITELQQPLAVRRLVSFAEAIYSGEVTIEGVTGRRVIDHPIVGILQVPSKGCPFWWTPRLCSKILYLAVIVDADVEASAGSLKHRPATSVWDPDIKR
jgi:hypothetical protein